jgi:hypothetical protein
MCTMKPCMQTHSDALYALYGRLHVNVNFHVTIRVTEQGQHVQDSCEQHFTRVHKRYIKQLKRLNFVPSNDGASCRISMRQINRSSTSPTRACIRSIDLMLAMLGSGGCLRSHSRSVAQTSFHGAGEGTISAGPEAEAEHSNVSHKHNFEPAHAKRKRCVTVLTLQQALVPVSLQARDFCAEIFAVSFALHNTAAVTSESRPCALHKCETVHLVQQVDLGVVKQYLKLG